MQKEIICLANSRKYGGFCVAGKDTVTGAWIRPVSPLENGELTFNQIRYKAESIPHVMDKIKIGFREKKEVFYQPENLLIDNKPWQKTGNIDASCLISLCDFPESIWQFRKDHPQDRIPADFLEKNPVKKSLLLVQTEGFQVLKKTREDKIKLWGQFSFHEKKYQLGITDQVFGKKFIQKKDGLHTLHYKKIYLCLSLGEPYVKDNCCYKLIATVIMA